MALDTGGGEQSVEEFTTDDLDIGTADFVSTDDFVGVGPSAAVDHSSTFSTTSTSYVVTEAVVILQWDAWLPTGAQGAVLTGTRITSSTGDVRVQNATDGETVHESLDVTVNTNKIIGPTNYTPTTANAGIIIQMEVRTNDGGGSTGLVGSSISMGVQV